MLTERQELILRSIVDSYLEAGRPVGSKTVAARKDVGWSPSTVRGELAALEGAGLLTHPHTSAGRVPTEAGYRTYVQGLLAAGPRARGGGVELELSRMRREVDEAMRETTTALSRMTDLVALVTAPPLDSATIHRVEALLLQPNVVMVVVISSAGSVTKRTFSAVPSWVRPSSGSLAASGPHSTRWRAPMSSSSTWRDLPGCSPTATPATCPTSTA
jgi:heat-inducible transcriptional repressor